MPIALFLDVDNVLTVEPAQLQFARFLGVGDRLEAAEVEFSHGAKEVSPSDVTAQGARHHKFNAELLPLFKAKGFSRGLAEEYFHRILLQDWVDNILSTDVDIYLISSGPNYFVEPLAEKYNIPRHRVLCSQYTFDSDGPEGIIVGCRRPVTTFTKSDYVRSRAPFYDVTIGVGDDATQDGPFLSQCTIRILTTDDPDHIYSPNLEQVKALVESMRTKFPNLPHNRVFIGSSSESLDVARAIQNGLMTTCNSRCNIWNQLDPKAGATLLDTIMDWVRNADFAVLIIDAVDQVNEGGTVSPAVRDNVLLEAGMFINQLGPRRTFLVHSDTTAPNMPDDLRGITTLTYRKPENLQQLPAALAHVCTRICNDITSYQAERGV